MDSLISDQNLIEAVLDQPTKDLYHEWKALTESLMEHKGHVEELKKEYNQLKSKYEMIKLSLKVLEDFQRYLTNPIASKQKLESHIETLKKIEGKLNEKCAKLHEICHKNG